MARVSEAYVRQPTHPPQCRMEYSTATQPAAPSPARPPRFRLLQRVPDETMPREPHGRPGELTWRVYENVTVRLGLAAAAPGSWRVEAQEGQKAMSGTGRGILRVSGLQNPAANPPPITQNVVSSDEN